MNISPSLLAHVFGALLTGVVFILIIFNFREIQKESVFNIIILLSTISGLITLHGLSHLGLESVYGFNPLKRI
jgi:hypothetical protein